MRAFVALDVRPPGASVLSPAPEHLTLVFLGESTTGSLDRLEPEIARAVRGVAPFDYEIGGVGAFPSPDRPRVIWRGVTVGRGAVIDLATRVRSAAVSAGWPEEPAPFVPHVTLFRVRTPEDRRRAADLLARARAPPDPIRCRAEVVALKESRLSAAGASHTTRREFRLTTDG